MKAIYKNYFKKNENVNPILKSIINVPIFKNLSNKELEEVLKLTHERHYKKDEYVFKMAPSEGMYVIVSGDVKILDPDTGTSFALLKNDDFFGELALLDEEPRSASAIAQCPSKLIRVFRTDLLTLIKRSPELGNKILINLARILGERLRKTNEELTTSIEN